MGVPNLEDARHLVTRRMGGEKVKRMSTNWRTPGLRGIQGLREIRDILQEADQILTSRTDGAPRTEEILGAQLIRSKTTIVPFC